MSNTTRPRQFLSLTPSYFFGIKIRVVVSFRKPDHSGVRRSIRNLSREVKIIVVIGKIGGRQPIGHGISKVLKWQPGLFRKVGTKTDSWHNLRQHALPIAEIAVNFYTPPCDVVHTQILFPHRLTGVSGEGRRQMVEIAADWLARLHRKSEVSGFIRSQLDRCTCGTKDESS